MPTSRVEIPQETTLAGTLLNAFSASAGTLTATFTDTKTGVARAPQTNTKLFTIDKDNSSFEMIRASSVSTVGTTTTITIDTNGRNIPHYGTGDGSATGLDHVATASIGCVDTARPINMLNAALDDKANAGANSDITSLSGLTTPLTVAQGGTGVNTLTDGGILLGSGTGAVTPMAVLADGEIIIGDGSGDPVALAAFDSSTGALKPAYGGTGVASPTAKGVMVAQGSADITTVAPGAASNVLQSNGTDWVSSTPPLGAAHTLLSNAAITDANNGSVARGAIVYGNSTPKWAPLSVGAAGSRVGTVDGVDTSFIPSQTHYLVQGYSGNTTVAESRWGSMFANNTRMIFKNASTATSNDLIIKPTSDSCFLNIVTTNAGATINLDMACRVTDGSTEYLIACADGGATFKRYSTSGTGEAAISFSGTAPTTARRIGWDVVNGHLWVMDGADLAATQIRRYTFSGTTLTNINSDITLGAAPGNAGSRNMLIGPSYMVLEDAGSTTVPVFKRYNKSTGAAVDSWAPTFSGSRVYRGFIISSDNRLYTANGTGATAAASELNLALFDLG